MARKKRFKKFLTIAAYIMLVLMIQALIVLSVLYYDDGDLLGEVRISSNGQATVACSRVVQVLEGNLRRIGEGGDAAAFLERAKILNMLAVEACTGEERHNYLLRALAELSVADALRMMNAPLTVVAQKIGFFWRERAEFFRMHGMYEEELDIYKNFLSIPGRGRDIFTHVKKAEVLVRMGRLMDAVGIYAAVAEICRTANNSNCFAAAVSFADLLEENRGNAQIKQMLKARWPREADKRDLFRHNREAANRIRAAIR